MNYVLVYLFKTMNGDIFVSEAREGVEMGMGA
jgi:hypothetical protein